MKKLTSLLLTLTLALSLFTVPASALTYGDWEYTIQNNEVYLTKYIGSGGDVKVPSTLNGVPVTKINLFTFTDNKNAETIYVPSSVKEIEEMSFQSCQAREITIAEGCTIIGDKAFAYCDQLEKINIPSTAKELGYRMLGGCDSLREVNLAEGITYLPERMCDSCPSLKTIRLPSTLQTIGKYAFGGITADGGLTRIDIPASVTTIEGFAFILCRDLQEVNFLGNNVKTIGDFAFSGCDKLEEVIFNPGLNRLGEGCFEGCTHLRDVKLPASLASIRSGAFRNCSALEEAVLPAGLRPHEDG